MFLPYDPLQIMPLISLFEQDKPQRNTIPYTPRPAKTFLVSSP
jgi:hypothetical protein